MRKPIPAVETPEQKHNRELIESIAKNIASLAGAVESLLNGPLKRKALVVLLASSSRMSQQAVEQVLTALADLKKDWLNK
jgi:hypothetical protein